MHPLNRAEVCRLIKKTHDLYPNKTIWVYTGFLFEDVKDIDELKYVDVLADGRFEKDKLDNNLHWVGSPNQRVIDIKKTLELGQIVLHT